MQWYVQKFKIGGIKRSIDKPFLVNSVVIKVADSCGASLCHRTTKATQVKTHSGGKNNSLAICNSFIFHSRILLTERSGIEESNGTKVTCFRQSFDAARIVRKP